MNDQQHCQPAVTGSACPEKADALVLPPYLLALIAEADTAAGLLLAMPTTAPDWLKACHRRQVLAEELAHAITQQAADSHSTRPHPLPDDCAALELSPRLLVLIGSAGAAFRRLLDLRATDSEWSEAYRHWQAVAAELAQVVTAAAIEPPRQQQSTPHAGTQHSEATP